MASTTTGFVLIIGIVITGALLVAGFGALAIDNSQGELETEQAENTLTQLDSKVALVALGETSSHTVSLPNNQYRYEDTGRITVRRVDYKNDSSVTVLDSHLGAVTYQETHTTLAYQGGGVWEQSEDGTARMVSPPEFHYRGSTVTLPVVNLTSQSNSLGEDTQIEHKHSTKISEDTLIQNELVEIEVQSEYYRGWGQYFEQRTSSSIQYDHNNQTVTAIFIPNQRLYLTSAIISNANLDIESSGGAGADTNTVEGDILLGGTISGKTSIINGEVSENQGDIFRNLSASDTIDRAANDSSSWDMLSGEINSGEVRTGSYYATPSSVEGIDTLNTSNGDINIYVDGDVTDITDMAIEGSGDVTVYVDGSLNIQGQPTLNEQGKEDQLIIYSRVIERPTEVYGILVTESVDIDGSGGGQDASLTGALVATNDVSLSGQFSVRWSPNVLDFVLNQFVGPPITFLHVSENQVTVNGR